MDAKKHARLLNAGRLLLGKSWCQKNFPGRKPWWKEAGRCLVFAQGTFGKGEPAPEEENFWAVDHGHALW